MNRRFKILGVTTERSHCDRCGRSNLKKVYVIETVEGQEFCLGSQCIRKAYQMTQKELTSKSKEDKRRAVEHAKAEYATTSAYRFLKGYLHSPRHHQEMKAGGYDLVHEVLAPHIETKQSIADKYRINIHLI